MFKMCINRLQTLHFFISSLNFDIWSCSDIHKAAWGVVCGDRDQVHVNVPQQHESESEVLKISAAEGA